MRTTTARLFLALLVPLAPVATAQTVVEDLSGPPYAGFDGFGHGVALSEGRALVGAPYVHGAVEYVGAAYVFQAGPAGYTRVDELQAPVQGERDYFGQRVALDGDVALVSAVDGEKGSGAGAVYVFLRDGDDWSFAQKLTASDGGTDHFFGAALALEEDRAVIGAPGNRSGAVYVFERGAGGFQEVDRLRPSKSAKGAGAAVALDGGRFIAGAPGDLNTRGAAYVFEETANGWEEVQTLQPGAVLKGDYYGATVALDGELAAVGAYFRAGTGTVFPFRRESGSWVEEPELLPTSGAAVWSYGLGLLIDGDRMVVANPVSGPGWYNGQDFLEIFERVGDAWELELPVLPNGGSFGAEVAHEDGLLLVGQPSNAVPGKARLVSLDRELFLFRDSSEISLATGGEQVLGIEAGSRHAGAPYAVLGSLSGVGPTVVAGGVSVPLTGTVTPTGPSVAPGTSS